ncbi:hypothetical protein RJ641_012804 [Dillenia turbinata]|uniref:Uncharacterized protein n=1 Tax=Dillenia turbinata TaxID=194707 RepID=A0AAN8V411_9MAGN
MGLSNFPSPAEGVLPVLVMNTVLSVALLKNMIKSLLQVMGAIGDSSNSEEDPSSSEAVSSSSGARERRISITQFKSLCNNKSSICRKSSCGSMEECVVCLCGFEADEERPFNVKGFLKLTQNAKGNNFVEEKSGTLEI